MVAQSFNLVVLADTLRPVVKVDSDRIDRPSWMHLLEAQAWVKGVVDEDAVGGTSLALNFLG